ncbi:membrane protein [Microbispora amethystogenes]|nr:membrane protein [Microbispora amethystogenes]
MFPAAARRVTDAPVRGGQADGLAALRVLHRVCRVYALAGLAVPVFGFATASGLDVLRDAWVIASILLTGAAAAILALWVLPRQDAVLALLTAGDPTAAGIGRQVARLAMLTGVFNLLWAAVTVLMIVRPGSTTGV